MNFKEPHLLALPDASRDRNDGPSTGMAYTRAAGTSIFLGRSAPMPKETPSDRPSTKTGAHELRIIVQIAPAENGSWTATLRWKCSTGAEAEGRSFC